MKHLTPLLSLIALTAFTLPTTAHAQADVLTTTADSLMTTADSLKAYHTHEYANGIQKTVETTLIGDSVVVRRKSWSILGIETKRGADNKLHTRLNAQDFVTLIPIYSIGYHSMAGDLDVRGGTSARLNLPAAVPIGRHFGLSMAIGFGGNLTYLDNGRLLHDEHFQTLYTPYDPGFDYSKHLIHSLESHLTLMPQWDFATADNRHQFVFGFGAELEERIFTRSQVNTAESGRSKWRGQRYTLADETRLDVHPLALNLLAGFQWNGLSLTASYGATNLFDGHKTDLKAHPWSISLGFNVFYLYQIMRRTQQGF